MKTAVAFAFSVLLLTVVASNATAGKPVPEGNVLNTGTIQGTITVSGQPFSGLVYIPGASFVARTDDQGKYVLYYVPVGSHTVMIDVSGSIQMTVGTCQVTDQQTCTLSTSLPCVPGMTKPCPLTLGVCTGKTQVCREDASWGACDYGESYSQTEICGDNLDNNCNGVIDDDCPACIDADNDGFCANADPIDCDDNDSSTHPGAAEVCGDGKDNDCSGRVDEGCE